MNSDISAILELVRGAPIGKITSVDLVGSGYASLAYKITSSSGEFIVLTQKDDGIEPADYAYHFAILKSLEAIEYRFAPRAVFIDPKQSIIIMTLEPGEPITWINNVSEEEQKRVVETLVTALLDLRAVSFESCAKLYKELSGKNLPTTNIEKNV